MNECTSTTPPIDGTDMVSSLDRLKCWLGKNRGNWILVAPNGDYWIDQNLRNVVDSGYAYLANRLLGTEGGAS